jgi:hypothetical protein
MRLPPEIALHLMKAAQQVIWLPLCLVQLVVAHLGAIFVHVSLALCICYASMRAGSKHDNSCSDVAAKQLSSRNG